MKKTSCALLLSFLLGSACARAAQGDALVTQILTKAKAAEAAGNIFDAIALIESGLKKLPSAALLRRRLSALNKKVYLTAIRPAGTSFYTVKHGDTLTKIARKYAITPELIMRLNGLTHDRLKIKQRLKVVTGPFDVRIRKKDFTLEIAEKGKVLFTYRVGLG